MSENIIHSIQINLTIDKSLLLFFSFSSCLSVIHSASNHSSKNTKVDYRAKQTFSCLISLFFVLTLPVWLLVSHLSFSSAGVLQILWWFPSSSQLIPNKQSTMNRAVQRKPINARTMFTRRSHLRFLLCFSTSAFSLLYFSVRYTKTQVIPEESEEEEGPCIKIIQFYWTNAAMVKQLNLLDKYTFVIFFLNPTFIYYNNQQHKFCLIITFLRYSKKRKENCSIELEQKCYKSSSGNSN